MWLAVTSTPTKMLADALGLCWLLWIGGTQRVLGFHFSSQMVKQRCIEETGCCSGTLAFNLHVGVYFLVCQIYFTKKAQAYQSRSAI